MLKKQKPTPTPPTPTPKNLSSPADEAYDDDPADPDTAPAAPSRRPGATALPHPATGPTKRGSDASHFDALDPGTAGGVKLPKGKYEAVLTEAVLQEQDEKGQSLRLKFAICHPDYEGNVQTTWFKFKDANDDWTDWGIVAWKSSLARMGYDPIPFDELEDGLSELQKEQPGVILSIYSSRPDAEGRIWPRVYIESACDSDRVQEYKDRVIY